ncbi:MAG: hypothetical protein ABI763_16000 [Bacteroidota bacterium]
MATVTIKGIQIKLNGIEENQPGFQQLVRTLNLLPHAHLRVFPTITVGDRPARGGGGSQPRSEPGGAFIRINRSCFNSSWNSGRYNETLLHEIGHIIDWEYNCMRVMSRNNPTGYNILLAHRHSGATHGASEHYADAYATYFKWGYSNSRMGARLQPLLTSEAFYWMTLCN